MAAYIAATEHLGGGTATLTAPVLTVTESVKTAWLESASQVIRDRHDADFLDCHVLQLLPVIHDQIRNRLADEWAARGRRIEWVDSVDDLPLDPGITKADAWAVWDAAAERITFTEVVAAAGLSAEYAAWH